MIEPSATCLLDDLGVLRIGGADAQKFLQGQLSNDVQQLRGDQLMRAGLHNAQGRALALLALTMAADDSVLALLPRELLTTVSTLLLRYVLRAKVTLRDDSDAWRVYGLASAMQETSADAGRLVRYGPGYDERWLLLQPLQAAPIAATMPRVHWRALDIAAGLPQIGAINSGHFVAQMLNLDCIDAVSFKKGCYTGQEIIARAHYRGRVKRRMQRFVTECPQHAELQAGATGRLLDGRHYQVVQAAIRDDARCEFLAVAHLPGAPVEATSPTPADSEAALAVQSLALPYAIPD